MSFLKNIFEKRKDSKYGKGHRLGDATQQSDGSGTSRGQTQQPVVSLRSNNEAAMKAAEAAMQRLQSKNNTPRASSSAARSSIQSELAQDDKELKKALELKDHYFGKPVKFK